MGRGADSGSSPPRPRGRARRELHRAGDRRRDRATDSTPNSGTPTPSGRPWPTSSPTTREATTRSSRRISAAATRSRCSTGQDGDTWGVIIVVRERTRHQLLRARVLPERRRPVLTRPVRRSLRGCHPLASGCSASCSAALTGSPDGRAAWIASIAEGDDEGYFGPESAGLGGARRDADARRRHPGPAHADPASGCDGRRARLVALQERSARPPDRDDPLDRRHHLRLDATWPIASRRGCRVSTTG